MITIIIFDCKNQMVGHLFPEVGNIIMVLLPFSEIYHGRRWHEDYRFKTHMVEVSGYHIYVGDIVEFIHPKHGSQIGKVIHFYEKVQSDTVMMT